MALDQFSADQSATRPHDTAAPRPLSRRPASSSSACWPRSSSAGWCGCAPAGSSPRCSPSGWPSASCCSTPASASPPRGASSVAVRQGAGLRAHMLMLAVAATLFAPILATGASYGGARRRPPWPPSAAGVLIGAFLFGAGMQIGGACASGTLFAVGSGQSAIVMTLAGFVSAPCSAPTRFVLGRRPAPFADPVSFADTGAGYLGGWLITMATIGAVVAMTYLVHAVDRAPAGPSRRRPGDRAGAAGLVAAVGGCARAGRPQRADAVALGHGPGASPRRSRCGARSCSTSSAST